MFLPLTLAISQPDLSEYQAVEIWNGLRFLTRTLRAAEAISQRPDLRFTRSTS